MARSPTCWESGPIAIQSAILSGRCVEFDYLPDSAADPSWRRIVPYGLIHGAITYLLGKRPDRDPVGNSERSLCRVRLSARQRSRSFMAADRSLWSDPWPDHLPAGKAA